MPCLFIDSCNVKVTKDHYDCYCLSDASRNKCETYMGAPHRQPREWKKMADAIRQREGVKY